MDEIGVARGTPRRARVRGQEEREGEREPWPPAQVPDDAVPVREPEVAKGRGRDDVDVDARLAQVLDRVADERPGDVVRPARVRRRQDDELHASRAALPKTTGTATASAAKT